MGSKGVAICLLIAVLVAASHQKCEDHKKCKKLAKSPGRDIACQLEANRKKCPKLCGVCGALPPVTLMNCYDESKDCECKAGANKEKYCKGKKGQSCKKFCGICNPEYYDVFGDGEEWRMAFLGRAGTGLKVYDAYTKRQTQIVKDECRQIGGRPSCPNYYRNNDALDNWANKPIAQVAFVAYKDGEKVVYTIQDGHQSDYLSWFSQDRVINSTFTDLKTDPADHFSIIGDNSDRRFFIQHNYGGCALDAGWFVVVEKQVGLIYCPWEVSPKYPVFKYTTNKEFTKWEAGQVGEADVIAVYIKYEKNVAPEYVDVFATGIAEWKLAFRGTEENGQSIYDAYTTRQTINVDEGCRYNMSKTDCPAHYRCNHALDNWDSRPIDQVAFVAYSGGNIVASAVFDGPGSDYMSWFSKDKLQSDHLSWTDLETSPTNYFSIGGEGDGRRFFINHNYGSCDVDSGWFVAVENGGCPWEFSTKYPIFKYSLNGVKTQWNTAGRAEVIAVYLKYSKRDFPVHFNVFGTGPFHWSLAFRGTAGNGQSIYDAYVNKQHGNVADGCRYDMAKTDCPTHYRNNDILDHWTRRTIDLVAFVAYTGGDIVAYTIFDARKADKMNWFSQYRVYSTIWTDLESSTKNYFSIAGEGDGRRFFINHNYGSWGSCDVDSGWFVAVENGGCPWENNEPYPAFLYANKKVKTTWNSGDVSSAEVIAIYVKYQ